MTLKNISSHFQVSPHWAKSTPVLSILREALAFACLVFIVAYSNHTWYSHGSVLHDLQVLQTRSQLVIKCCLPENSSFLTQTHNLYFTPFIHTQRVPGLILLLLSRSQYSLWQDKWAIHWWYIQLCRISSGRWNKRLGVLGFLCCTQLIQKDLPICAFI